jgi:hypothetical protein
MIKWNEVTWYSKMGAIVVFLAIVPILSFYLGEQIKSLQYSDVSMQSYSAPSPVVQVGSSQASVSAKDDPQAFNYAISKMEPNIPVVKGILFESCGDIDAQQPMNECFGYEEEYYNKKFQDVTTKVSEQVTPTQLKTIQDSFSNLENTICSGIVGGQVEGGSIAGTVVANCESYFKLKEIQILQDQVLTDPIKG